MKYTFSKFVCNYLTIIHCRCKLFFLWPNPMHDETFFPEKNLPCKKFVVTLQRKVLLERWKTRKSSAR